MKALLLAAGYATRLYPLTKNFPKPLLEVAGKTIMDRILEKIEAVDEIDTVYIVTNHVFRSHFNQWAAGANTAKKLKVIDDGTSTNETRLGAVGDIRLVLDKEQVQDDLMILAGDNLFDFALPDFVRFFMSSSNDCISCHVIDDIERIKRTGVVELDEKGKVVGFQEKPAEPRSNLGVPPFYIYRRETLPLIGQFLDEGNNGDAPGHFIPWLLSRRSVSAYRFEGTRYDIGTLESYEQVKAVFSSR